MRDNVIDHKERLSALIADIHDAALDPSLWIDVLAKAARFVGGPAASLSSTDAAGTSGNRVYCHGIDPHYWRLYLDQYVALDPTSTGHFFAEIEEPIATADVIPYGEFVETRFYREWARPQGLVDVVAAVLDKTVMSAAMFRVFRHERDGVTDDATRRRMRLIAPHIRRAMLVARLIKLKTEEAETFADTLDGLSAGVILVDADGQIVHANAAGHVILGAGDFLRATGGRLIAGDAQADLALRDIFTTAGNGDFALGIKGIALPLTASDGKRHVAHVLPLTSGARYRTGISTTTAALFVHKTALKTPSRPDVIASTYKLTPTELRVLLAIVEIGGVPEVADALGIAESTVKTHLGRLFEKTGAARQADLVKLIAGFSSPLVGGLGW
jgi:DNA-binding CsgD family transcriptional regulator/PAS domain-containing protein